MSEYIMHIAVMDDVRRVVSQMETITPAFREVLEKHPDIARYGSTARGNHIYVSPLLAQYRERWEGRTPGDPMEKNLAFVMGWIGHRAADSYFKPVHRILNPDYYFPESEDGISPARIYNDVVVYEKIYDHGREGTLPVGLLDPRIDSHPGAPALRVERIEPLLHAHWQGELLGLQTLTEGSFETQLEEFLSRRQDFYVPMEDYYDAYHTPDPQDMQRFIVESNFYNPDDPIIRLARSVQQGQPDGSIDPEAAFAASASQSQYAQALHLALSYMKAASAFFEGDVTQEQFEQRLDFTANQSGSEELLQATENLKRARAALTQEAKG